MKKLFFIFSSFLILTFTSCTSSSFSGEDKISSLSSSEIDFYKSNPEKIRGSVLEREEILFGKGIKLSSENENSFVLAVVPDVQNYFHLSYQKDRFFWYPMNHYEIARRQMEFIKDNSVKNGGPVVAALFLGDLVNDYGRFKWEWKHSASSIFILDDVLPFSLIPGNHDYDKRTVYKDGKKVYSGSVWYNRYFGPQTDFFKDKDWFGGYYENGLNTWMTFSGAGKEFLVLALEFEPSDSVLDWAQNVLDTHPSMPVILTTHSFLESKNNDEGNGKPSKLSGKNEGDGNSPQALYDKFISKNKNIFLVLCGHVAAENRNVDINEDGYTVYSLLSDYQDRRRLYYDLGYKGKAGICGDGWLRLMTFDFDKNEIRVQTYSPEYRKFETDDNSQFTLKIDWDWDERFSAR